MKIDLKDTTFIIVIRLDSIIRLENLIAVIRSLLHDFRTNIMVLEASSYDSGLVRRLLPRGVDYSFVQDDDPILYRTKYLNQMTKRINTRFTGIWDSDVIIDKVQIIDSIEKLRNNDANVAYPYDGTFVDTSLIIREIYIEKNNFKLLCKNRLRMSDRFFGDIKGGAILIDTSKYKESGMENEFFYGYGAEDNERYARWATLGYSIYRTEGCLYHLNHPRDINGQYRSKYHIQLFEREVYDSETCTKEEMVNKTSKISQYN